ncbi:hypothetical protein CJ195_17340 [Bacillus sp. UMB0899]|uniref:hypothetical protein n=1 Tax=Metabacillus schmidteae TaxID=2730405 RepID=UPI000C803704|nr:hypothetical protein [Metabacillus schmidteae]PMC36012.1 hypothetical protein CJ195_17340 [Bacillus sp. UMB0899]
MKKQRTWIPLITLIIVIYILHSTPHMSLRTYVFFTGYPIQAFTSGIVDDTYHNEVDKENYEKMNAKAYTFTDPPTDKQTQGVLSNYLVRKYTFIYITDYLGDT